MDGDDGKSQTLDHLWFSNARCAAAAESGGTAERGTGRAIGEAATESERGDDKW
jgi:hypothetical protein